jgi:polyisoprenyl-phosphate glycosyltransferase
MHSTDQNIDAELALQAGQSLAKTRLGKVSVVIPVYRSEQTLRALVSRLLATCEQMGRAFEIVLVDDCSPDGSWPVLKALRAEHGTVLKIVRLIVNSGQHNALLCGFSLVTGDVVVTMDDDLQNPPEELPKLVAAIDEGFDLAIGAYDSKKHSHARNAGGSMIDSVQRQIFALPRGFQLTSFRAAKRVVIDNVKRMGGSFPYVTCMLLANVSSYTNVPVRHDARVAGQSNYTLRRSLRLAANLILNYSSYPLYFVSFLCALAFLFSLVLGISTLVRTLVVGTSVPGWATTVLSISFFNGLTLLAVLVLLIYVSRINQQVTRSRLSYAIDEIHA